MLKWLKFYYILLFFLMLQASALQLSHCYHSWCPLFSSTRAGLNYSRKNTPQPKTIREWYTMSSSFCLYLTHTSIYFTTSTESLHFISIFLLRRFPHGCIVEHRDPTFAWCSRTLIMTVKKHIKKYSVKR
jgi:hypothetical protein